MSQSGENQYPTKSNISMLPNGGILTAHNAPQPGIVPMNSAQPKLNGFHDNSSGTSQRSTTTVPPPHNKAPHNAQTHNTVPAHNTALYNTQPNNAQPYSMQPIPGAVSTGSQWPVGHAAYSQLSQPVSQLPHKMNSTPPPAVVVAAAATNPPPPPTTGSPHHSNLPLGGAQQTVPPVASKSDTSQPTLATADLGSRTQPTATLNTVRQNPMPNGPTSTPPSSTSPYDHIHPGKRRHYPKQPLPVSSSTRPPGSQPQVATMNQPPPGSTNQPMTGSMAEWERNQTSQPSRPTPPHGEPPPPNNQYQPPPGTGNRSNSPAAQQTNVDQTRKMMGDMSVQQSPYGLDLMRDKQTFPKEPLTRPKPPVSPEMHKKSADADVIHCTFNAVPSSSSLQRQCKLPFGVHTHPFKEMQNLPIISNSVITRCRSCRTYLNPFVSILDHRRWQCNMCYRVNDIPEELCYEQTTRQYQDVRNRPELTSSSFEFIAPSEYMLRPPQPSIFLFVLDITHGAVASGYVKIVCDLIRDNIDNLPGDSRCMIGFLTFHKSIHFYNLKENQPQMIVMSDIDDVYVPVPDGLLVNVREYRENILDLMEALPIYAAEHEQETLSATGAALQVARKMLSSTGGRITLFQTCLPSAGPGRLTRRETDASDDTKNLNPATDFYKKIALECAGEQIAVDLFILSGQYTDLASLSCASRFCSGCIHYYPEFHSSKNPSLSDKFSSDLKRYLTRPIGFEAVMRMRCTKGLSINTFHGNFFVRSTDLLSLPNVNPDSTFAMQIEIEDSLADVSQVCFQAALLYTNTSGERRIRIHTLALPVTSKLSDIYQYADQQAVISTLSKMAVDRTLMSSLGDAREALMNACQDFLKVYRSEVCEQKKSGAVLCPPSLRFLPLLILALMKNDAFKLGGGVSLDRRLFSLLESKSIPFLEGFLKIYPRLYSIVELAEHIQSDAVEEWKRPGIMQATAELLNRQGIYLMDNGKVMYLFVGRSAPDELIQNLFNVSNYSCLPEKLSRIPELNNSINITTRKFVKELQDAKQLHSEFIIIREDGRDRTLFINNLIDDRTESSMSYQEFLQHLQRQLNG